MADAADSKAEHASSVPPTCENHSRAVQPRRAPSDDEWQARGKVEPAADCVEAALADALTKAADAGQWQTVDALNRELTARREARAAVVSLDVERKRRER